MATIVKFYKDGKKVKDITSIGYLPVDEDAVKDSRHLASSGSVVAAAALGEESMMANLPIADNTLRFSFGDTTYNPTEHWDHHATTHLGLYKPKRNGIKSFNTDFSKVSNANYLFEGAEIVQIPDLTGIPASTSVNEMFKNCRDAKYGILEAYNLLSSQNNPHDNATFLNCGIDTEEGRAALTQIPQSWGGTMEEEP